jgi:2,4-dienoyl-CoA reductase (NADPH2)
MDVAGVKVRLGVTATKDVIEHEKPDAVICATGASYTTAAPSAYRMERTSIPGHEQHNVLDVGTATRRALQDPKSLGKRIVILDETAGYLPLGLAEVLAMQGQAEVEVFSPHNSVGEEMDYTLDGPHLFPRLAAARVKLTAQHFIERIDGHTVTVYYIWGGAPRVISDVDTVIISVGRTPNDTLFNEIHDSFNEVHRVGDVLAPRAPAAVIYEGEKLGREI